MSGLPPPGIGQFVLDLACCEINHGDAAHPFGFGFSHVRAAIGDVELLPVAARIQTMRTPSGRNKSDDFERCRIDDVHAIGLHVGDKEDGAVGRDANVLRHVVWRWVICACQFQITRHLALHKIDLRQLSRRQTRR